MRAFKSWKWLLRNIFTFFDGGTSGFKMKQLQLGILCTVMLFIVYRTTNYQYQQTESPYDNRSTSRFSSLYLGMLIKLSPYVIPFQVLSFFSSINHQMEAKWHPFDSGKESNADTVKLNSLPRGIIQARSDLEFRPLWSSSSSRLKLISSHRNLLAIPVGIKQKDNVDAIVQKFLSENFTIILFHYDGNLDGWWDLDWTNNAIHIVAQNQTKWWFAKRFLHPDVVSIYDYIFLWDEDLGVKNFSPRRYLKIVKAEGLEISQPALDPNSTDIHHRITVRKRTSNVHRRVYDVRGSVKCSNASIGPPCTGFVEGMAPVFSRSAWSCAWHLIQNDLVHGWGMDMKLGYCAQGDRTKKVGVVDSEFIVHQGIQTLGGNPAKKPSSKESIKRHGAGPVDERIEIRRQSTYELQIFKKRWEQAVKEDKDWVDPFMRRIRKKRHQSKVLA